MAGSLLWKIRKWASRDLQCLELFPQMFPQHWRKAVACSSSIQKLTVLVVAEDQSIEILWAGCVPADHEFLSFVDAHLSPGTGASARLIGTGGGSDTEGGSSIQRLISDAR